MSGIERLAAARRGWTVDPEDPDFWLEYDLEPGDRVRLTLVLPIRLAQRLHRPPHLRLTASGGGWRLNVTLGLTAVYRLAGTRLDGWLERLARCERVLGARKPRPSSPRENDDFSSHPAPPRGGAGGEVLPSGKPTPVTPRPSSPRENDHFSSLPSPPRGGAGGEVLEELLFLLDAHTPLELTLPLLPAFPAHPGGRGC